MRMVMRFFFEAIVRVLALRVLLVVVLVILVAAQCGVDLLENLP